MDKIFEKSFRFHIKYRTAGKIQYLALNNFRQNSHFGGETAPRIIIPYSFQMGLFEVSHDWKEGKKAPSLKSVTYILQ